MAGGALTGQFVMALTFQYDDRVPKRLKVRRALATPLYVVALALGFVSDGIASLAAALAKDPH
jgi:hypothetical protein